MERPGALSSLKFKAKMMALRKRRKGGKTAAINEHLACFADDSLSE